MHIPCRLASGFLSSAAIQCTPALLLARKVMISSRRTGSFPTREETKTAIGFQGTSSIPFLHRCFDRCRAPCHRNTSNFRQAPPRRRFLPRRRLFSIETRHQTLLMLHLGMGKFPARVSGGRCMNQCETTPSVIYGRGPLMTFEVGGVDLVKSAARRRSSAHSAPANDHELTSGPAGLGISR